MLEFWAIWGLFLSVATAGSAAELEFRELDILLKPPRSVAGSEAPQLAARFFLENLMGGAAPEIVVFRSGGAAHYFDVWRLEAGGRKPAFRQAASVVVQGDNGRIPDGRFAFVRLGEGAVRTLVVVDHGGTWRYDLPAAADGAVGRELLLDYALPGPRTFGFELLDCAVDVDGDGVDELILPDLERPLLWKRRGAEWVSWALPGFADSPHSYFSTWSAADPAAPGGLFPPGSVAFGNRNAAPSFYFSDGDGDGWLELYLLHREYFAPSGFSLRERRREAERLRLDVYRLGRDGFESTPSLRLDLGAEPEVPPRAGSRTLYQDLDGDGLPDRLVAWANFDPVAPAARTEIFLARGAPLFAMPPAPDYGFRARDFFGSNYIVDVNGDGVSDLFQTSVDYMVSSTNDMAAIALGQSLRLTLQGYLSEKGGWPRRSTLRKPLELLDFQQRGLTGIIELRQDFTGDGRPDLAFFSRPERLEIYPYDAAGRNFAGQPAAKLGARHHDTAYADFNGDGRSDVLSFDAEKERLTVWLSRK